jgi:hypothetical protein
LILGRPRRPRRPLFDSSIRHHSADACYLPITGYQLHLHTRRTIPLPEDDFEARQILDRERTWIDLYCFDQTFFLQSGEDDDVHQTCMIPHHKIDIRSWLNESKRFGVEDDLEQGANFECARPLLCLSRTICLSLRSHTDGSRCCD